MRDAPVRRRAALLRGGAVVCLFLLRIPVLGATEAPSNPPSNLLIHVGRLLDVRTGKILTDQAILIEGQRIKEVGAAASVGRHADPDTRHIELGTATAMPGLVDVHVHLLLNWKDDSPVSSLRTSSPQGALWGVHNAQIYLSEGFTTLRDACESDAQYGQFALRDSIAKGLIQGPRILSAGGCISVTGGHGDSDFLAPNWALPRQPNLADSPDEIATVVRRDLKYGADWIKVMATGGVGDVLSDYRVQELSEAQMAKAVEVAHRAGHRVMAHAEGVEGIKAAVRAGVDSIEHGTMLDEEGAALMERAGTWLVPTLYAFQYGAEIGTSHGADPVTVEKTNAILKEQQPAFERALKHHVKIAFGDDNDPEFASREFEALVRGGMTPLEALQAATINSATLLGLVDQIGSMEAGKFADIIAVQGDPLSDIHVLEHVAFVMKGGAVIRNDIAPAN